MTSMDDLSDDEHELKKADYSEDDDDEGQSAVSFRESSAVIDEAYVDHSASASAEGKAADSKSDAEPAFKPTVLPLDEASIERGRVWIRLLESNALAKRFHNQMYAKLLSQDALALHNKLIMKDVHRTFPTHKLFMNSEIPGKDVMFRLLKAFSVYDMQIGFSQGLAFLCGMLIMHIPSEEDVFWALVQLMGAEKFNMRTLYEDNNITLKASLTLFDSLLSRFRPKLHTHLRNEGVDAGMFATQWFVCMYTHRMPLAFAVRVWDAYLADSCGLRTLLRVGLAIMAHYEKELLALEFEKIVPFLNSFEDIPLVIVERAAEVPLSKDDEAAIKAALMQIESGLVRSRTRSTASTASTASTGSGAGSAAGSAAARSRTESKR